VGERRWRAHKLAGLSEIDAIIRDSDNSKAGSLIENVQREDLSVGKKAAALDMAHIVSQVENDSSSLVSVALQSGSYPSVFEENAEDFVFLTFRDDI